jgi:probable HAF family extracellular repeat protein
MIDLGTLGGSSSIGLGINNLGQVTGSATTAAGLGHAFLYRDGQMIDLNNVIDPALGVTLFNAQGINDEGQIVANSFGRAFLLTPVPEPGTLAFLGAALLVLIASVYTSRRSDQAQD